MLASAIDVFTKTVNSPPGQLAAGGVLAGIVWKFFERVEAVLTDDTKLEIAVWLMGVKVGRKVMPWTEGFDKIFDQIFGTQLISWTSFLRSSLVTCGFAAIPVIMATAANMLTMRDFLVGILGICLITIVPGYVSLLKTRLILKLMMSRFAQIRVLALLLLDVYLTAVIAAIPVQIVMDAMPIKLRSNVDISEPLLSVLSLRALRHATTYLAAQRLTGGQLVVMLATTVITTAVSFSSLWLSMCVGSGFLLKGARRLDIGFDWFNRKFDIEKKPLQSIGLVAGALVAVAYWSALVVGRVVK